jgi:hypothetical protein
VCFVPGEGTVTFVSAADAARHGITRANDRAGMAVFNNLAEICQRARVGGFRATKAVAARAPAQRVGSAGYRVAEPRSL